MSPVQREMNQQSAGIEASVLQVRIQQSLSCSTCRNKNNFTALESEYLPEGFVQNTSKQ